ncbi:MAG: CoA transferase [Chloroflexi bacterium]|nr:CoA transferase [Chloroflexota bacterium]
MQGKRPLSGIRALELAEIWAGPFCGVLMGDMGAEVIKVEAVQRIARGPIHPSPDTPGYPDDDPGERPWNRQANFNALNRNKLGLTLDLGSDEGREAFRELARLSDVVFTNYAFGVMDRLGLGYEDLRKVKPDLIVLFTPGYGNTGPYKRFHSMGMAIDALSGHSALRGYPDLDLSNISLVHHPDAVGGVTAFFAICSALFYRARTGKGQFVDIAMSDGVLYLLASAVSTLMMTGRVAERGAFALNGALPQYNVYECSDGGWISLGSLEGHFWVNLCNAMDREDFIPYQMDGSKRDEVFAHFREKFKTKTRDEWFEILKQTDICVAPVYSLDEALEDPHNVAREMVIELEHPQAGKVKQVGIGTKLSETPGAVRSTTPVPGQHTDEVLADLGFDSEAISAMREGGIVA